MKKDTKRLYEGMFILSATLSDDARKKALERIVETITQFEGAVEKTFDQGRKRLAYEIGKKREGHYYILYFSAPTTAIKDLWKEYHLNEDLVRFMTLQVEAVPDKIEFKSIHPQ